MTDNSGYNPQLHHRRSIRLRDYDYSYEGAYYITICAVGRRCLFGQVSPTESELFSDVDSSTVILNNFGLVTRQCWEAIPAHFADIELDAFVIMPNHLHGIVVLPSDPHEPVGARHASPLSGPANPPDRISRTTIGTIVGSFKSAASKRINELRGTKAEAVWQRNYYERIIRDEKELDSIREYIYYNPMKWASDENNLANL
jgi:REP element-mobilizing transposase RayT